MQPSPSAEPNRIESVIGLEELNVGVLIHEMDGAERIFDEHRAAGATTQDILHRIRTEPDFAKQLFEAMPIVDANSVALRIFGFEKKADLIRDFSHTIVSETLHGFRLWLDGFLRGESVEVENVHQKPGSLQRVHVRVHSTFNKQSDTDRHGVLAISTVIDITDHVDLQRTLKRTQDRQKLAIDATQLGIWEANVDAATITFDEGYHQILGYRNRVLNGSISVLRGLMHPLDLALADEKRKAAFQGDCLRLDQTVRLRLADGSFRWCRCLGEVTEFNSDGLPGRLVGTMQLADSEINSKQLLQLEREVLGLLASGRGLSDSLRHMALGLESIWGEVKCAINLHDPHHNTLHFGAAPSMGERYAEFVEGFRIEDLPSVCGTAVQRRSFFAVSDIDKAPPEYTGAVPFYRELGIRGLWSVPVYVGDQILATCCAFFLSPREPTDAEVNQLERLAQTVGLLIEAERQAKVVTEFESKIRTKERLESLGKLAGGIAHDFNNLLSVMLMNAELISMNHEDARQSADQIVSAGRLAAELCAKMLTYAGEIPSQLKTLDISEVATEIMHIVQSGSPVRIEFKSECAPDLPPILGDQGMISQMILNLATNAVESISGPGCITIETGQCDLSQSAIDSMFLSEKLVPGECVFVRVTDTGQGIAADELLHIFDPFFSTKPDGRGLGLATVFGAVRRHQGGVHVNSVQDEGTVCTIYLPAANPGDAVVVAASTPTHAADGPSRLIAVVDDEDAVRDAIAKILRNSGFEVLPFSSGNELVSQLDVLGKCDYVLLDQQMAGLNGLETYHVIRKDYADLPICFISGYTTSEEVSQVVHNDPACESMAKPFRVRVLLDYVSRAVDENHNVDSSE